MVSGHLHFLCGELSVHVFVVSPGGLGLTTPLAIAQCDFGSTFPLLSCNGLRSPGQRETPKDMASASCLVCAFNHPGPGLAPFP